MKFNGYGATIASKSYTGFMIEETYTTDLATALRDAGLANFRELIETSPVPSAFGNDLNAHVAELVGDGKVKLRSSTNVEDLENFSGAGLYESYRARATGDERASWVVRKVWSSAWTFGAFEERAWWNVEQSRVAMGVAVNPAASSAAATVSPARAVTRAPSTKMTTLPSLSPTR